MEIFSSFHLAMFDGEIDDIDNINDMDNIDDTFAIY